MIPVICLDDGGGLLFNGRRQSQDRELRRRLLSDAAGHTLWMNAYSHRQFARETGGHIAVDEAFLEKAGPGDYCFVEDQPLAPCLSRMEGLVVYRWNRKYPGDTFLDIALDAPGWTLAETEEFAGSSHEKITKEVYTR